MMACSQRAFYEHFGFMVLPGATMRLAIPMATALKVIGRGSAK
jgi:hypothetical protein